MKYLIVIAMVLVSTAAHADKCRQASVEGRWWMTMTFGTGDVNCAMVCERLVIDKQGYIAPNGFCRVVMSQADGYPVVETPLSTTGRLWMNLAKPAPNEKNQDQIYCDRSTEGYGEEFCLDNGLCFHMTVMQDHDWMRSKWDSGEIVKQGHGVNPGSHLQGLVRVNNGAVGTVTMMRRSMGPNQVE